MLVVSRCQLLLVSWTGPVLTWSQSATPNGCNAWLLPEDIFKTDRICTPLPILCLFALNLYRRSQIIFDSSCQVARMKVWFVRMTEKSEKCVLCLSCLPLHPWTIRDSPISDHLVSASAGGLWILVRSFYNALHYQCHPDHNWNCCLCYDECQMFLVWFMSTHKN